MLKASSENDWQAWPGLIGIVSQLLSVFHVNTRSLLDLSMQSRQEVGLCSLSFFFWFRDVFTDRGFLIMAPGKALRPADRWPRVKPPSAFKTSYIFVSSLFLSLRFHSKEAGQTNFQNNRLAVTFHFCVTFCFASIIVSKHILHVYVVFVVLLNMGYPKSLDRQRWCTNISIVSFHDQISLLVCRTLIIYSI